jgi:hypothetical protein
MPIILAGQEDHGSKSAQASSLPDSILTKPIMKKAWWSVSSSLNSGLSSNPSTAKKKEERKKKKGRKEGRKERKERKKTQKKGSVGLGPWLKQ